MEPKQPGPAVLLPPLLRFVVRSHCSFLRLVRTARVARALCCACSFARSTPSVPISWESVTVYVPKSCCSEVLNLCGLVHSMFLYVIPFLFLIKMEGSESYDSIIKKEKKRNKKEKPTKKKKTKKKNQPKKKTRYRMIHFLVKIAIG